jgi:hypothetical protein
MGEPMSTISSIGTPTSKTPSHARIRLNRSKETKFVTQALEKAISTHKKPLKRASSWTKGFTKANKLETVLNSKRANPTPNLFTSNPEDVLTSEQLEAVTKNIEILEVKKKPKPMMKEEVVEKKTEETSAPEIPIFQEPEKEVSQLLCNENFEAEWENSL